MQATPVVTGFHEQFDQHGAWRREAALRLKLLGDWLDEQQLLDGGALEGLQQLIGQLRADKIMVAFVAEFSRGKSELINAVFFAGYGRRIMPASAGRTTMCPTELGWDAGVSPCLRLLPIESRLEPQALMEWRMAPERWTRVDLDVNDAAQLAGAMEKVSEVNHVSVEQARALGFWHDDRPQDNPPVDAHGRVEVPRWRHALINMAHPLLKQGLVVLDTPGLNAIGAEPELTVNLIAQAQAVVFVLGADTGVTRSDLSIWQEHLAPARSGIGTQLVVLNKIDTLWDELRTPAQVQAEIARQCEQTARTLELDTDRVVALSAQKGLLAKVRGDAALLQGSRLPRFETLLGQLVLGTRQHTLEQAVARGTQRLQADAQRALGVQRREKLAFDRSAAGVLAVRSVHVKLLREVFALLSSASIKKELATLAVSLREPGLKLGVRKVYADGFDRLRAVVRRVVELVAEIDTMLGGAFRQLNTEHGFGLQVPTAPELQRLESDLAAVERSHVQYLGMSNLIQLTRAGFTDKLIRSLHSRVRAIFETAVGEIELWNKAASGQLDVELRERRRAFTRRIEAIQRIQDAAGGLDERLRELDQHLDALHATERELHGRVRALRESIAAQALAPLPEAALA
mgnify:CR=1 FL=1